MAIYVYIVGKVQLSNPPLLTPYVQITTDHFDVNNKYLQCELMLIDEKLNVETTFTTCLTIRETDSVKVLIKELDPKITSKLLSQATFIAIIRSISIFITNELNLSDIKQSLMYFNNNTLIYHYGIDYYILKYSNSIGPIDLQTAIKLLNYVMTKNSYELSKNAEFLNIIQTLFISQTSPSTIQGNVWVGRTIYGYKLLEKIGEGGNSTVYKVEYKNSLYAMKIYKILPPSPTQSITVQAIRIYKDIYDESSNLIALSDKSKNLVKIFAIYVDLNRIKMRYAGDLTVYLDYPPVIVMEYMEGGDIWQIVKDQLIYSTHWEKVVAKIGLEIANALEVIHNSGYVHLDVKPSNFLLSKKVNVNTAEELLNLLNSGQLVVKLGDLGSARKIGESILQLTPAYAPPEQFDVTSKADPSMDVFSLGASLYAIYKGIKGFNPTNLQTKKYERYYQEVLNKVASPFEKYLLKMTSPNPKDRPTIDNVRNELTNFLI
ncbi:serine/threonine protein kinase [Sulfolobus sp. S-194]|uniref:serine/threonine-protein kinase n=1 Tax=Sulfolobus sp. S-194 TaxID=2512240 RepID=UPI0014373070|nr:serine/threonine-protein kinase [Sulfolobus sp. S-194]QIW24532.1 serine/threonine protein kinase [Sulfolobus sp. S-194]